MKNLKIYFMGLISSLIISCNTTTTEDGQTVASESEKVKENQKAPNEISTEELRPLVHEFCMKYANKTGYQKLGNLKIIRVGV